MRGQLLFTPSDSSRLLLGYDYVKDDTEGHARVPFPVFDTGQVGAANNLALAALRAIWPAGSDVRKAYSVPESFQEREINGLTARYENDASYGSWTVLGGWRNVELNWLEDLDGLKPFGFPPVTPPFPQPYGWVLKNRDEADEDAEQYSLEVRLTSPADARVFWVARLYYFTETVDRTESFLTQFSLLAAAGGDVTFVQDVDSDSYAAFGQITYPFTDRFSTTLGLRYTEDEKDARQIGRNNDPNDATPGIPLFPGQPYDVHGQRLVGLGHRPIRRRLPHGVGPACCTRARARASSPASSRARTTSCRTSASPRLRRRSGATRSAPRPSGSTARCASTSRCSTWTTRTCSCSGSTRSCGS